VTYPEGRPRDWVVTDTAGSLLAWLEYPGRRLDRSELVVDDSDSRAVLDRTPIAVPDGGSATILAVADLAAARRGVTGALVVGPSAEDGRLLLREGSHGFANSVHTLTISDSRINQLVDPHTGEDVEIRAPADGGHRPTARGGRRGAIASRRYGPVRGRGL